MKRAFVVLIAMLVVTASTVGSASETAEFRNREYEELRVLEPLIGSWRMVFVDDDGVKREWVTTIAWSSTRKMIVGSGISRIVDSSPTADGPPWHQRGYAFYVWNSVDQRIELFNVGTAWGSVVVSEVKPQERGVITYSRIRGTTETDWIRVDTVTSRTWTTTLTRCDVPGSTPPPSVSWTLERVKPSGE
jgi:hypothetical protein